MNECPEHTSTDETERLEDEEAARLWRFGVAIAYRDELIRLATKRGLGKNPIMLEKIRNASEAAEIAQNAHDGKEGGRQAVK